MTVAAFASGVVAADLHTQFESKQPPGHPFHQQSSSGSSPMEVTTHVAFDSGTGETKVLKLKEMETLPELSEQLKALEKKVSRTHTSTRTHMCLHAIPLS